MIVQDELSLSADAASQRYGMMIDALRLLHSQAVASRDFGSARLLNSTMESAYQTGSVFLDAERHNIQHELSRFSGIAHISTLENLEQHVSENASEALSEHLDATDDFLERELSIQIDRDIAFLRHSLIKLALSVGLAARAHGVPLQTALLQFRATADGELTFFFQDRMGRRIHSRNFVRGAWRHNMLGIYNETVLMTLAENGIDQARVRNLDPASPHEGVVVSLGPSRDFQTYSEIRNLIFHPNSRSILQVA